MSADDCCYMGSDGVCRELYLGGLQTPGTLAAKARTLLAASRVGVFPGQDTAAITRTVLEVESVLPAAAPFKPSFP